MSSNCSTESIADRVAVIVGAAGGMGRAIAARLARAGCRLALVDLEPDTLDQMVGELALESSSMTCAADIADRTHVNQAAEKVEKRFGGADILINAAGINTKTRTLDDMSPDVWERVIAVNLTGVFHCTQAFLPAMKHSGGGVVVTIASTAAIVASPGGGTHYCASKRALLSLTESINKEQGKYGIRACAISPGEVDTPLIDKRPQPPSPERRAAMLKPADIAEAVYFVVTQPPHVTISDLVIWPSAQISGTYTV
jgi:NAD(P)-dependent dehydrogenase (short-subunit alcohol dehydrogenase family)